MKEGNVFGRYMSDLLDKYDLTLREFARRTGIDASNLSKIERGVAFPPQKKATLDKMAKAFGLDKNEREKLIELAQLAKGRLPPDLKKVRNNAAIPVLLRAIDNKDLTEEEVKRITRLVEKENSWQGKVVE
jgi:transcriptional regulator with XRE-family HTH domain